MVRESVLYGARESCTETITAILQCKINTDTNCCEFAVTPAMLREAKHSTADYNREHENK